MIDSQDTVQILYTADQIKLMPNYVDPYKHQRKYQEKKKKYPEFCEKRREQTRLAMQKRYHNDPDYRERKKKAINEWRKAKNDSSVTVAEVA